MKKYFKAYLDKFKPILSTLAQYLTPLKDYWLRLSQRDQQVLIVVGVISGLMLIALAINSAIDFKNQWQEEHLIVAQQRADAQFISKQFKDISQITPNDFSDVKSDRIKGDAKQVLEIDNTEVILADNNLTIKANNVKFEAVMQFLEQLRNSYGLFPDKLKITRVSQSGYVEFSVNFKNVEQD